MTVPTKYVAWSMASLVLFTSEVAECWEPKADDLMKTAPREVSKAVASGDLKAAVHSARKKASETGKEDDWQRLLVLSGWISDQANTIRALNALVQLRPSDHHYRFRLAQTLLWEKRFSEGLPHGRWLVKNATDDAAAIEVGAWLILSNDRKLEALPVVRLWVKLEPTKTQPRLLLADLTHWSAHWRESRQQYKFLKSDTEYQEKAKRRLEMLRVDHPHEVRGGFSWWGDNQDVSYTELSATSTQQLPARLRVDTNWAQASWKEDKPRLNAVQVVRATFLFRYEWFDEYWPEFLVGVEGDSETHVAIPLQAGMRFSVGGKIFGRLWMGYDRFRVSRNAAYDNIRHWGPRYEVFAEPRPWFFVSSAADYSWISDENARLHFLGALGVHNTHSLQVEPRVYAELMEYREHRDAADPYYTPEDAGILGADLTLRYQLSSGNVISGRFGVVEQNNQAVFVGGGTLKWRVASHLIGDVSFNHIGSPEYLQDSVTASLGWMY